MLIYLFLTDLAVTKPAIPLTQVVSGIAKKVVSIITAKI